MPTGVAGATPARAAAPPAAAAPATSPRPRPGPARRWPTGPTYLVAGGLYLALGVVVWWGVWRSHPSATATCGCGDPSLFTWFLEWPAYALVHGHSPVHSTALFHPGGINLLSNTSVLALGIPLIPVTLLFGPVATLNVALTLAPALSALAAFWLLRRWVQWSPAAFAGALLFGFGPSVLAQLEFDHLMTAWLVVVPLWVGVLDDLLLRRHRSPLRCGLSLAALALAEFFVSTEVLVILLLCTAIGVAVLAVYAAVAERAALAGAWRRAAAGLGIGAAATVAVLALPAWYALAGPGHLSGAIWPHLSADGGSEPRWLIDPHSPSGLLPRLGGYFGPPLPPATFVGWGLLAVLAGGLVVWHRDRRLWFFAVMALVTGELALGLSRHHWMPWNLVARLPLFDDIVEQRFFFVTLLAGGAMLAVVLDRAHRLPASLGAIPSAAARVAGAALAGVVAAVALVPVADALAPVLPLQVVPVTLPAWFAEVGPSVPPGTVVLAYPSPSSGVQASMTWQAVDGLQFAMASGGGPQGTPARAGRDRAGFQIIADLGFGLDRSPTGTPAQLAAVRAALRDWGVTTVVVPFQPGVPAIVAGRDAPYDAAFMTLALGRAPAVTDGSWVWQLGHRLPTPLSVGPGTLQRCSLLAGRPGVRQDAVTSCVVRAARPR